MKIIDQVNDLEGQYCNINCIGCDASSLATAGLFVDFWLLNRVWRSFLMKKKQTLPINFPTLFCSWCSHVVMNSLY